MEQKSNSTLYPSAPYQPSRYQNDTIVAISTPPGRGGIGIVRLSGPQSKEIAERILRLRLRQPLIHATARLAEVVEMETKEGNVTPRKLDEALVTWFAEPNSYTGEDIVEIAAHGSPIILEYLIRHALARGARLARPGEFTERAFLSGRIDLTQAEAVRDLIEAQTLVQARIAAEQLDGALSHRIAPIKEELLSLIAALEAGIDFAEDDIDLLPKQVIGDRIFNLQSALEPIAASYAQGRLVHDGLKLAIVGRPNAGKSSLFNSLVERDRAIVTPIPGTTRDLVTERVSIDGIPVELIDTAGLRETLDEAEALGIAKTREAIAEADLVLLTLDATALLSNDMVFTLSEAERTLLHSLSDRRVMLVVNKIDLLSPEAGTYVGQRGLAPDESDTTDKTWRSFGERDIFNGLIVTPVSALTGKGIANLRNQILTVMQSGNPNEQTGLLTTVRHEEAVAGTQAALATAHAANEMAIPHEMLLLDLHSALANLDSLTGTTTPDDILNRIFSTFCIGK
jgi:tRNA modification GTPase